MSPVRFLEVLAQFAHGMSPETCRAWCERWPEEAFSALFAHPGALASDGSICLPVDVRENLRQDFARYLVPFGDFVARRPPDYFAPWGARAFVDFYARVTRSLTPIEST